MSTTENGQTISPLTPLPTSVCQKRQDFSTTVTTESLPAERMAQHTSVTSGSACIRMLENSPYSSGHTTGIISSTNSQISFPFMVVWDSWAGTGTVFLSSWRIDG